MQMNKNTMSTPSSSTSKKKLSSYDAFSSVDSLVSKPVMGSDGAASWQEFQSQKKIQHHSRGVAPHMPLKRSDRLSGMTSIHQERMHEQSIRKSGGDRDMGSGYTVFKRKGTDQKENAAERKRLKMVQERTRPDDAKYFIRAESGTFEGWKEDYIFTTRDRGTGYYWDGMDSLRKLNNISNVQDDVGSSGVLRDGKSASRADSKEKSKKKKKKKKSSSKNVQGDGLPTGWEEAIDPSTSRVYYFNRSLNQTVWERPIGSTVEGNVNGGTGKGNNIHAEKNDDKKSLPEKLVPSALSLPKGWQSANDPASGKIYYYNVEQKKTVWERPTE